MAEPWKWNGEPTYVVPASSRFAIGVSALHGLSSSHVTWTVRIIVTRDGRGAPPVHYKIVRPAQGGRSLAADLKNCPYLRLDIADQGHDSQKVGLDEKNTDQLAILVEPWCGAKETGVGNRSSLTPAVETV
jgi:hypothetical protein